MPIITFWNALVEPRVPQFGRWFDSFERSCFLLERWLEKRLPEAEKIERLTSAFPVFRFYNDAVTAQVTRLQYGALLSAPPPGVGTHIERALEQWDVVRRLRRVVRENRLLPELLRVFEQMAAGVLASVNRFRTPTAATFDPSRLRAADLPGLAALAWNAVVPNQGYILDAARGVRDAIYPDAYARVVPRRAAPDGGGAAGWDGLVFQLDELARYVVAALMIIPAVGRTLGTLGGDALLRLRYMTLERFEGIEAQVFAFRRRILDVFVTDLHLQARQALIFLATAREFVIEHVRFYARVGIAYMQGVIDGVGAFARQLGTFWTGVVGVIQAVVSWGDAVLAIDIGEQIHLALVAVKDAIEVMGDYITDDPTPYEPPDQFPVTIGEFVMDEGAGARANSELSDAITMLNYAWREAGPAGQAFAESAFHAGSYVAAMRRLQNALALRRAGPVNQPTLALATGPATDLQALILDPLRAGVSAAVARAAAALTTAIDGVAHAAVGALDAAAAAFDRAVARAVRPGPLDLLQQLTANTDTLLSSLFGGQEARRVAGPMSAVADAYQQWLVQKHVTRENLQQSGFDTIGAVLAGFVGMMLSEWTQHLQEGSDTPVDVSPTSPRRLLERARLGRVHTAEVRIVATGQELGPPLAARIADGFQGVVQAAYATGQAQLGHLLEAAP